MELKIVYSKKVNIQLKEIFLHYSNVVGISTSKKFILKLKKSIETLIVNPYLGKEIKNNDNFRYLIYSFYFIIYKINKNKNQINIILLFDTRQNPIKLIDELKKM